MKKAAFTLAEVMIFFVIMGVIIATMLTITNPVKVMRERNVKYRYANAYDTLNTALYDMVHKKDNNDNILNNPFELVSSDPSGTTHFTKLCNGLASYINTVAGSVHCSVGDDFGNSNDSIKLAKNEDYDFNAAGVQPNMVTQNGMKFYLTDIMTIGGSTPPTPNKVFCTYYSGNTEIRTRDTTAINHSDYSNVQGCVEITGQEGVYGTELWECPILVTEIRNADADLSDCRTVTNATGDFASYEDMLDYAKTVSDTYFSPSSERWNEASNRNPYLRFKDESAHSSDYQNITKDKVKCEIVENGCGEHYYGIDNRFTSIWNSGDECPRAIRNACLMNKCITPQLGSLADQNDLLDFLRWFYTTEGACIGTCDWTSLEGAFFDDYNGDIYNTKTRFYCLLIEWSCNNYNGDCHVLDSCKKAGAFEDSNPYVSGMKCTPDEPTTPTTPAEPEITFSIAYVDLGASNNAPGTGRPHTIKYEESSSYPPDVYAFALLSTGEVIPLGLPEANINYFPVRVKYIHDGKLKYSNFYSMNQAKNAAWGWYSSGLTPEKFIEGNVFTYGDYIKNYLVGEGSQLYSFYARSKFKQEFGNGNIINDCKCDSGSICDDSYDKCEITEYTQMFGNTKR